MTANVRAWILLASFSLALAACDDKRADGGGSAASTDSTSAKSSAAGTPAAPTISGTPATSVTVGAAYKFLPTTTAPAGSTLTFSISNQPAWTTFDTATGGLSGTPSSSQVGTFANIVISVSDGGPSVALAPFSVTVASAAPAPVTLSWTAPQENTNGTSLTDLTGYRIYYGPTPENLNQVVSVDGNVTTFELDQLQAGTWYFAVAAINAEQVESELSAVVPLNLSS